MPARSQVLNLKFLFLNFVLLFFFLLTAFPLSLIFASTPLETAKSDYSFQYTKFRDSQEKFINAKAAFVSFKTSAAKNEAYLKTRDYLTQGGNLYLSYIALVKEYGNTINWQDQTVSKDAISKIADEETAYFKQNLEAVKNAQSLEELTAIAKTLKDHIEKNTRPKINFALANYEFVNAQALYRNYTDLSTELTATPSASESSTSSLFTNRKTEIENIRTQSKVYLDKSQETLSRFTAQNTSSIDVKSISDHLEQFKAVLKRSKALFAEALKTR